MEDDLYSSIPFPAGDAIGPEFSSHHHQVILTAAAQEDEGPHHHHPPSMSDIIKAQIASHPLYPNLLSAYIDCKKV